MRPLPVPYAYGGGPQSPFNVNARITGAPVLRTQEMPPSLPRLATHRATSLTQDNLVEGYLYHWQNWSSAAGVGANQYNFFGSSQNQSGLNELDTNMQQPGNTGAGVRFLVEHMWVAFLPGVDYVSAGVEATLAGANAIDDTKAVMNTGFAQFTINQTPQLGFGISPLLLMGMPVGLQISGGVGAGVAAMQALAPIIWNGGYNTVRQPFWLDESQNFSATLRFPTAVTLPSANNTSRIGWILKGRQTRPLS